MTVVETGEEGPMKVVIVEGYASDLATELGGLVAQGFAIRFVLPNGVNRWTIVAERAQ